MEPQAEPDYDAVELFWVQGVVRDGQVVLDPPLNLPDGTVVTVTKYDPDDNPLPEEPAVPFDPAEARAALFAWAGRPELADDPDWRAKLGKPQ
jgi:hypothetical protein